MNEEEKENYRIFLIAFRHLMIDKRVMSQAELSKLCPGISPPHISMALKQGKGLSEGRQRKIAKALGYPDFDDFLELGRNIINGTESLPPSGRLRGIPFDEGMAMMVPNAVDDLVEPPNETIKAFREKGSDKTRIQELVERLTKLYENNPRFIEEIQVTITEGRTSKTIKIHGRSDRKRIKRNKDGFDRFLKGGN